MHFINLIQALIAGERWAKRWVSEALAVIFMTGLVIFLLLNTDGGNG